MKALLTILLLLTSNYIFSQAISINNTGAAPDQSTILDIQAFGKGIRIPSMKSIGRPESPADGLMYYQINDTPGLYIYTNGQWGKVFSGPTPIEHWIHDSITGNIYYEQGNVGIGVSDPKATLDINRAPLSQDTFTLRIRNNSNPLLTAAEGLSIGTIEDAPPGGLHVNGYTTLGTLNAIGRLNIEPVGDLGFSGSLDPEEAGIVLGSSSYGMFMDYNKIENSGTTLKLNSLSGQNITLGEGGGKVGVGLAPEAKLHVKSIGNLNNNGVLSTENVSFMVGNTTDGLLMDNNQLESVGSTLFLNLASTENVSIGKGGGLVGVGVQNPTVKLDVIHDDWQLKLRNDNEVNENDWLLGSSGPTWIGGQGKFLISPTSNPLSSLFTLSENGNIGLGTHDPQARVHVLGGTAVSLGGGSFLSIGNLYSENIAFDENEIMSRDDGEIATLAINRQGGNVGIGTAGPLSTLHVKAQPLVDPLRIDNLTGSRLSVKSNGGISLGSYVAPDEDEIIFKPSALLSGYFKFSTLVSGPVMETSSFESGGIGNVGKPLQGVYSNFFYAGTPFNFLAYSDRRLKENIEDLDNAMDILKEIQGVKYELKEEHFYGSKPTERNREFLRKNQIGFIAQDLEKILPQLVHEEKETGYKTVGYMGLIPILVEAMKELSVENQEMKKLILEQSKIIKRIDAQLNDKN